jgi:hypothetical protein
MFDPQDCSIPTVYCGKKKKIPVREKGADTHYVKKGTVHQCIQKGFGAGMAIERAKNLPVNSLQRIKYVGEVYESNFKKKKINNTTSLIKYSKTLTKEGLKTFLESVLIRKDDVVDMRAYNSTLLYLYKNGIYENLPSCSKINFI